MYAFEDNIRKLSEDKENYQKEWIYAYEDANGGTCICNHKLKYANYFMNTANGHVIRVGNDCMRRLEGKLKRSTNGVPAIVGRIFASKSVHGYERILDLIQYSQEAREILVNAVWQLVNKTRGPALIHNLKILDLLLELGFNEMRDIKAKVQEQEMQEQEKREQLAKEALEKNLERQRAFEEARRRELLQLEALKLYMQKERDAELRREEEKKERERRAQEKEKRLQERENEAKELRRRQARIKKERKNDDERIREEKFQYILKNRPERCVCRYKVCECKVPQLVRAQRVYPTDIDTYICTGCRTVCCSCGGRWDVMGLI